MLEANDLIRLRAFVAPFLSAVAAEDAQMIDRIYSDIRAALRCDPAHALADALRQSRESLARAHADGTEYASAYLDQKRRVAELRSILDTRAGGGPVRKVA